MNCQSSALVAPTIARQSRSTLMEEPIKYLSFRPKLMDCLNDYSREKFLRDILAGLTVGIVALPLAIGFGIASGVSPGAGIYTAIIGGFLVFAFWGSRVQIGGAAGGGVGVVFLVGRPKRGGGIPLWAGGWGGG